VTFNNVTRLNRPLNRPPNYMFFDVQTEARAFLPAVLIVKRGALRATRIE